MTRDQLEHSIRAACNVSDDNEVWVFGSQAILGAYPNAPDELRASVEVDIQPKNRPENTIMIDGALGEGSLFNTTHGFYVHGVEIEAAKLPDGWQRRTIPVTHAVGTSGHIGWCIEPHDLAASKLFAYRERDREFVRVLLANDMVTFEVLEDRIGLLPIADIDRERMLTWLLETVADLQRD
jgi:hypothetical protein